MGEKCCWGDVAILMLVSSPHYLFYQVVRRLKDEEEGITLGIEALCLLKNNIYFICSNIKRNLGVTFLMSFNLNDNISVLRFSPNNSCTHSIHIEESTNVYLKALTKCRTPLPNNFKCVKELGHESIRISHRSRR